MTRLLLDPGLFEVPLDGDRIGYWGRLADWNGDSRVRIGAKSYTHICTWFAQYGWPDREMPLMPPLVRSECNRILGSLLSRLLDGAGGGVGGGGTFIPAYVGSLAAQSALVGDIRENSIGDDRGGGIASDGSQWEAGCKSQVAIDPGPPGRIELLFCPGAELSSEVNAKICEQWGAFRLNIVGGQVDNVIIASIEKRLGIPASQVQWLPCEPNKKPRELKKRWGGLDPMKDIAICITGRVGHSTSEVAETSATDRGVRYLPVYKASRIVDAIIALGENA